MGSREGKRPYCSRVCCTHTMQDAIKLKEKNPDMQIYVLYRDIRTYGVREKLYKKARDMGVIFIRYSVDKKPQVSSMGSELVINIEDPILKMPVEIYADYICLATGIVPTDSNSEVCELFKLSKNAEGFIDEAHPKLRPVDSSTDGVFIAGLCNYPKSIDESIAQAKAAAARASIVLSKEFLELDAIKSFVTDRCDGCGLCVDVCPYNALKLTEITDIDGQIKKRISPDPALCKGCGLCEATCPKGGILVHGFTLGQIETQVETLLNS